jgi:hypothetical protein
MMGMDLHCVGFFFLVSFYCKHWNMVGIPLELRQFHWLALPCQELLYALANFGIHWLVLPCQLLLYVLANEGNVSATETASLACSSPSANIAGATIFCVQYK